METGRASESVTATSTPLAAGVHMQSLIIYQPSFNPNYHTFTLILLLCSKFPGTELIKHKCFEKGGETGRASESVTSTSTPVASHGATFPKSSRFAEVNSQEFLKSFDKSLFPHESFHL